ncbi:GNAT family N-acetyltransferase [Agromyces larvae]|uniref:GNAT family N-acetyltransferase n=1 Tax=Agromyces larvae TaxID=2929802 RepID=A0ABY4C2F9_9MICO|nr:GNAT family N-acetyltransferase [Agromyces larvae]UOE45668.1 GNAT family N-acetyltransferase [Agromyces larvae]
MQIRRTVPEDAALIAPLLGQLGYPTAPAALAARLERAADDDDDPSWIAVDDATHAAVGFAAAHCFAPFELDGPVSELTALVVDDGARRAGIGRALVATFEAWAEARGCVRMSVATSFRRTDAHRFYERLGYVQLARKYEKNLVG